MEDLFKGQVPEGEECDLQIFIFPHLREFMTIDLRYSDPVVNLLNTQDIFTMDPWWHQYMGFPPFREIAVILLPVAVSTLYLPIDI